MLYSHSLPGAQSGFFCVRVSALRSCTGCTQAATKDCKVSQTSRVGSGSASISYMDYRHVIYLWAH